MIEKTTHIRNNERPDPEFTVPLPNCEPDQRRERLKQAVKQAGGVRIVAEKSGVPFGTISGYISGREMKVSALIALAEACDVTLDWLATGKKSDGKIPAKVNVYAAGASLFATLNMSRLGKAIELANFVLGQANAEPSRENLGRVVALLYDSPTLLDQSPTDVADQVAKNAP